MSRDSLNWSEALRRLIGPSEPVLSCEECFAQVDRYVELELAHEQADAMIPGMRGHLEGYPACSEEHASLRDLVESELRP